MTDTDWWTRFEKTGCIVDYLSYKGVFLEEKENPQTAEKKAGEKAFESVDCSYGDDTVRGTYR